MENNKTKRSRKGTKTTEGKIAALSLERMKLSDLKPHPRNVEIRNHPEPGSPRWITLSKSLAHDYFDPIVYNERNGFLVSGHLRLKVMLADGFSSADVVVVDYDEPTHIARMLAANRTMGEDDLEGQRRFFEELSNSGFSLDLTGFDISTLREMNINLPGLGGEGDNEHEDSGRDPLPSSVEKVAAKFGIGRLRGRGGPALANGAAPRILRPSYARGQRMDRVSNSRDAPSYPSRHLFTDLY